MRHRRLHSELPEYANLVPPAAQAEYEWTLELRHLQHTAASLNNAALAATQYCPEASPVKYSLPATAQRSTVWIPGATNALLPGRHPAHAAAQYGPTNS